MRTSTLGLTLVLGTLAGCEMEVNAPPPAPAEPTQATSGGGQTMQQGGGSALGKAKQSAGRIEDQVELHNRRIEEAAEDINNP